VPGAAVREWCVNGQIAAELTESAVVLSGPVHRSVGKYLQLKARSAVQLPPSQDPSKVTKIRQRTSLKPPFDLSQPFSQAHRRVR
jgi:hypothetical protein